MTQTTTHRAGSGPWDEPALADQPYVHIPETVSQQTQEFLRTLKDPALIPEFPDPADISGWKKLQAWAEADGKAKSELLLKRYEHTVEEGELGALGSAPPSMSALTTAAQRLRTARCNGATALVDRIRVGASRNEHRNDLRLCS
jgi:hypothetical protein